MRTYGWMIGMAAAAVVLAGCGGEEPSTPVADPEAEARDTAEEPAGEAEDPADGMEEAESDGAATLATASTDLGTILVDGEGRTLYVFDNDAEGESSCDGQCAETWPPLTGEATAGGDVDAALLGSIERTDGTTQVTYDGSPLYYYAADSAPGGTSGQGVGDVWWVVGPDGSPVTAADAEEETSGTGGGGGSGY